MAMEAAGFADTASAAPREEGDSQGGGGDGYGSEDEGDFLALEPAATDAYVFVANPSRNTVTRVAVLDLSVITARVGVDPSVALTTPDYSKAVVFNEGSDDLTIINAQDMNDVVTVDLRENYNQMVMSPNGLWVACFHDAAAVDGDDGPSGGTESHSEVSLVNLDSRVAHHTIAGAEPRQVLFTDDSQRAVVISDDWVAIFDLDGEEPERTTIALSEGELNAPEAEEAVLSPDGRYLLVRQYGATELIVVDLETKELGRVPVGENPTDIDVTPDGAQAVAVARTAAELWLYDLSDPFATADVVALPPEQVLGSVLLSADNTKGLLYSTQSGLSRYAAWDRETDDEDRIIEVRELVKPVSGMALSPSGSTALIFHDFSNGDTPAESDYYNEYALTMVNLEDFFPHPLLLTGKPTAFAQTDDGETGFFIMDRQLELVVMHYKTLGFESVRLASPPVYLGVLPETSIAHVSQEHDLGRISFYDVESAELETMTGFELNNGIEH
jgi:hypothetical protein